MSSHEDHEAPSGTWADRADAMARSVTGAYGHRLFGLPGTWIGWVDAPARRGPRIDAPWAEWHYWWQAHFVDCLVDAAHREWHLGPSQPAEAPRWLALAQRLLRTVRLRNLGFRNTFFDDMAWLALAAARADRLSHEIRTASLPPAPHAASTLGRQLLAGNTADLGGGMFWNTKRQYKNTAATAPTALFFARSDEPADRQRAEALVDWLYENLLDPGRGLFLDGIDIRHDPGGYATTTVNHDIWTYNQGPILGALLELGGENLARAEELVEAVDGGLTENGAVRSDGDGGDAGLFRGILVRYLALAALDLRLAPTTRETAARLVLTTAGEVWAEDEAGAGGTALSARLQAWMVVEAAATLA